MMTPILVATALFGLAVGSFLNVVICRVPLGLSVVKPGSACPGCGHPVRAQDNIPVVSWLVLHGRCRSCRTAISVRYPVIEALTAGLFVLTAVRFGASWTLPAELFFVAGIIALGAVDLERYRLPRAILYPTLALVAGALIVAAAVTGHWHRLVVAVACSAVIFALFFLLHFARPGWLGFGDVRLAALLGLALGWMGPWYLILGLIAANLAGAVVGIALMTKGRASASTRLPYGLFLGAGCVSALLVGAPIISWYSAHLTA
jgi:leader peptidase (prepilin peptidase)/N-methyltransferase